MAPTCIQQARGLTVRRLRSADFAAAIELQRRARPLFAPWTPALLDAHLRRYPAGQLVATRGEAVVGLCASLKLRLGATDLPAPWAIATSDGTFRTHRPDGDVLYVASIAISPDAWRPAVRRALDDALLTLALVEHVARVLVPVRLRAAGPDVSWEAQGRGIGGADLGTSSDPVLRGLIALGFRVVGPLADEWGGPRPPDHLAALLEWRADTA